MSLSSLWYLADSSLKDENRCRNHSRATKIGVRMWKRNELCSKGVPCRSRIRNLIRPLSRLSISSFRTANETRAEFTTDRSSAIWESSRTNPWSNTRYSSGFWPGSMSGEDAFGVVVSSAIGAKYKESMGRRPGNVRAPRGTELSCKGWPQEAALRMLMNNLDPEVAERPEELVVYGGAGRAARSWEAFDAIVRSLRNLADDETLLVQSGKPVGVFRTHEAAPRVLIANSNLVGEWDNWDEFRRLEQLGLTMYGQMTAGSWIYIGSQGIVQGTYECFAEIARRRFGGSLAGTITVTAGLGGMGGAQPLAVTMNGGVALCVEVDPERIRRRLQGGFLDEQADDLDDAVARCLRARAERRALSVGLCANAADALPALQAAGFEADVVTDQTSAHDPLDGYVPNLIDFEAARELRASDPDEYVRRARAAMAAHCAAMVGFLDSGAEVFDYGNSLRAEAELGGFERAFAYPGFVPAYIRPLFCDGKGPFRWVALSGDPADIAATNRAVLEEFADDEALSRWIRL